MTDRRDNVTERERYLREQARQDQQFERAAMETDRKWEHDLERWRHDADQAALSRRDRIMSDGVKRFDGLYRNAVEDQRNNRDFSANRADKGFSNGLAIEEEKRKNIRLRMEIQNHFAELAKKWAAADMAWADAHWKRFQNRTKAHLTKLWFRDRAKAMAAARKRRRLQSRVMTFLEGEAVRAGKIRNAKHAYAMLRGQLYLSSNDLNDFFAPRAYSVEEFAWSEFSDDYREQSSSVTASAPELVSWCGRRMVIPLMGTAAQDATRSVVIALADAERAEETALKQQSAALIAAIEQMVK